MKPSNVSYDRRRAKGTGTLDIQKARGKSLRLNIVRRKSTRLARASVCSASAVSMAFEVASPYGAQDIRRLGAEATALTGSVVRWRKLRQGGSITELRH